MIVFSFTHINGKMKVHSTVKGAWGEQTHLIAGVKYMNSGLRYMCDDIFTAASLTGSGRESRAAQSFPYDKWVCIVCQGSFLPAQVTGY